MINEILNGGDGGSIGIIHPIVRGAVVVPAVGSATATPAAPTQSSAPVYGAVPIAITAPEVAVAAEPATNVPVPTIGQSGRPIYGLGGGLPGGNLWSLPSPAIGSTIVNPVPVDASTVDPSATVTASATDPTTAAQDAASALLAGGNSGVPGSGSIASDVPVATSSDTTSTSGPQSTVVIVLLLVVAAGIGIWFYIKHRKKSPAHTA